jgi:hypothetical protein
MKTFIYVFGILIMLVLSMVGCSDKSQSPVAPADQSVQEQGTLEKCTVTPFTVNLHYPLPPYVLDPGVQKIVGKKWIIKNVVVPETLITTSLLITGKMIHSLSGILEKNTGEGPMWGTYTLTNDAGGVWEGTYEGWRSKTGEAQWTLPLKVFGHGKSGNVQGMKSFFNDVIIISGTPPAGWPPAGWYGSGEGYIKSHGVHH